MVGCRRTDPVKSPLGRLFRVFACSVLLCGALAPAPAAAVTQAELQKAKEQRQALQRQLDAAVARYEQAESHLANTQEAMARAQLRLHEAEKRLAEVQGTLARRANVAYRQGAGGLIAVLLDSEGFSDFLRRLVLLEKTAGSDSAALLKAARARGDIAEQREDLAARRSQERDIVRRLEAITEELDVKFRAAAELEQRLLAQERAEQERRRREAAERAARAARVARRSSSFNPGSFRCPVDGPHSFRDSWGEPRSGGRRHQGVDIYAAHGAPVAAVVDGTVSRSNSSLGGISVYLQGADGSRYFYAHLAGHAEVSQGERVSAGTHVGYVGNSGNARGGPAHLHFEIHPGGGAPINPYPTVRAACG